MPTNASGFSSTTLLNGLRSCSCPGPGVGVRGASATASTTRDSAGNALPARGTERRTFPVLGATTSGTEPDSRGDVLAGNDEPGEPLESTGSSSDRSDPSV